MNEAVERERALRYLRTVSNEVRAGTLLFALLLVGCGDPVVGEWEGDFFVNDGRKNGEYAVTFEEKGTGESTVTTGLLAATHDISWEGGGKRTYEISETCRNVVDLTPSDSVSTDDCEYTRGFEWTCELSKDGEHLDCQTTSLDESEMRLIRK